MMNGGLLTDFPTLAAFDQQRRRQGEAGNCLFCMFASRPFSQGAFRKALKGTVGKAQHDFKRGDKVVVKAWISEHPMTKGFWDGHLRAEKALCELVSKWNAVGTSALKYETVKSMPISVIPYKANGENTHDAHVEVIPGEWCLAERFLDGDFTKWNSNTTTALAHWASCIQAFCHWTYHESRGKRLCCDAQGVMTPTTCTLTDPCIVSDQPGAFGITDGGPLMAARWFADHRCNSFCDAKWLKPKREERACAARLAPARMGTTYATRFVQDLRTSVASAKPRHITTSAFSQLRDLLGRREDQL